MMMMKSLAAGVVAAIAVVIGIVLFEIVRVAIVFAWLSRSGSGGIGAVSSSLGPVLLAAVAAFVVGFWWQFRRQRALRKM